MGELLACPFCRDLFSQAEASICPECDLPLVPLKKLPLSREALMNELEVQESIDPPEDQDLGVFYLGRERGRLMGLSLVGVLLFFMPWVHLERPSSIALSGYELAAHFAPWIFGGAIGQFLLLILLYTRRTVLSLRGIRVIAVFFSLLTAGEAGLLLIMPPVENQYFSSGLQFQWALYTSLGFSLLASWRATRLGGSSTDLRDLSTQQSLVPDGKGQLH